MMRLLELLFNGRKPVDVNAAVNTGVLQPQRDRLTEELHHISKSYEVIDKEMHKMKKEIDTAVAIAISTGGIK